MAIQSHSVGIMAISGLPRTVDVPGGNASHVTALGGTATAQVSFGRNGVVTLVTGTNHDWHLAKTATIGDDYEVRATLKSGTAPTSGPTLGSWHALTTARTWSWIRNLLGSTVGVLEITVRRTAFPVDQDTGDYQGTATIFDPS